MSYLILIRHGESKWNNISAWTGLTDIGLSENGFDESRKAGKLIKDIPIQIAFTSKLIRTKQTLAEILKVLDIQQLPTFESEALNERDYGDFTGKNKFELEKEYGEEQFLKWRRGWDEKIPNGETLKDVYNRAVPYFEEHILPKLKAGKNVLISAHGNSLRALIKFIEKISDKDISDLELETGDVYIYEIDEKGQVKSKEIRVSS
jgi:2,3-bisphosphoglycerate-dependent phosphoglycerate mutase